MAKNLVTLRLHVRWWVMPYVHALALFCMITGLHPDEQKVAEFIVRRGFKIVATNL